jgi:hypothetical protein
MLVPNPRVPTGRARDDSRSEHGFRKSHGCDVRGRPDQHGGRCSGRLTDRSSVHHRHAGSKSPNHSTCPSPSPAREQALKLSPNDILQHLAAQRQISDDLLLSRILVLESHQPLHLRRQHTRIFFLPVEIGRWLIPAFRQISATETPSSPCFRTNAFCASENCDAFIV